MIKPFATGTKLGEGVAIDTQRLLNCYAQFSATGKSAVALVTRPGLADVYDYGSSPARGVYASGDSASGYTIWAVHFNVLTALGPGGGPATFIGMLNTTQNPVWITGNGRQIFLTDGVSGYIYDIAAMTFHLLSGAEGWTVKIPRAVTYLATYFVVMDAEDGSYFISDNFNGLSWSSLDQQFAETDPDGLVTIIADSGELWLFGSRTIEIHYNSGAADFPFTPKLGATAEWGTPAPFSVSKFDGTLAFLGQSPQGGLRVFRMQGYTPQRISDDGIEHELSTYGVVFDAVGFSADYGGHSFYWLTFPTEGKSWVYDGLNNAWFECQSDGGRFIGEYAAGREGATLVTDYRDGRLYEVADTNSDGSLPIHIQARAQTINENNQEIEHNSLTVVMEQGTGGITSDAQAMLRWSNDNARTWSHEYWRSLGKIGQYSRRARWNRLGTARSRTYEVRITDPVPRKIVGMVINGD